MALSETIDLLVWVFVLITINGFILPLLHVPSEFILISFVGTVSSSISFRSYPNIVNLVGDIHGDRIITQRLILPISPWMVFLAMAISCFLITMWICIWVLPLSLTIMWQFVDIKNISLIKFGLIFVVSSWFFSVLPLFMASFIKNPRLVGKVWMRFLFPLWFFGGFQFTWFALYEALPAIAIADLINPYLYMMEGNRVAILGQPGNLPFWLDMLMLVLLSCLCFLLGVKRLKKQMDII